MINAGEPLTREEAVKILDDLMTMRNIQFLHFSQRLAVSMAIKALEQSEQKNGKKFIEIVVEYPAISTYPEYEGKPYFSIRYEENGEKFESFGTYNPEVLSKYIREYFMGDKKDKWIKVEKVFYTRFHSDQSDTYHEYRCTVCLKASDKATNYCPECGAKMEIEG